MVFGSVVPLCCCADGDAAAGVADFGLRVGVGEVAAAAGDRLICDCDCDCFSSFASCLLDVGVGDSYSRVLIWLNRFALVVAVGRIGASDSTSGDGGGGGEGERATKLVSQKSQRNSHVTNQAKRHQTFVRPNACLIFSSSLPLPLSFSCVSFFRL